MSSEYLRMAFDPGSLRKIVKETYKIAAELEAQVIVARGLSGVIVASAIGAMYDMPFAVVRKPLDSSHSTSPIEVHERWMLYRRWIVVDDFIVSGSTLAAIHKATSESRIFTAGKCLGIVLYNSCGDYKSWDMGKDKVPIYRVLRHD